MSSQETFQKYLTQLRPLLAKYREAEAGAEQLGLYHPSLAEWFTQSKFCGPAFACDSEAGVNMIREWKTGKSDKPDLVCGLEEEDSKMWMMLDTQVSNTLFFETTAFQSPTLI